MTHVFCNWKLMSLHFPHLFLSCIPSPLAATCLFSVSMIPFRSVTLVHLFLFLDSIYMWNHTIFVFLFIYLFLTVLQSYHICLSLSLFFFFCLSLFLFVYSWLCWVFVAVSREYSLLWSTGLGGTAGTLSLRSAGSVVVALSRAGPKHVGSSRAGIGPVSLLLQVDSQPLDHQGRPVFVFLRLTYFT